VIVGAWIVLVTCGCETPVGASVVATALAIVEDGETSTAIEGTPDVIAVTSAIEVVGLVDPELDMPNQARAVITTPAKVL
jgi:hypothetical protein